MNKNIYVAIYQPNNEVQEQVLGITFDNKQAFEILQNVLRTNENVKTEHLFVKQFIYKKTLKIIDINN